MSNTLSLIFLIGMVMALPAAAQQQSLAATLNVYVFPSAGQAPDQQSRDESACYQWAVTNTGVDPFEVSKQLSAAQQQAAQTEQQTKQSTQGSGAKGALGGAAMGALIGEIASDDAGEGAAYGAALGAIMGRRKAKSTQQTAQQQSQQQTQQAQAQADAQVGNFKKAFSVCLEANQYMVKY